MTPQAHWLWRALRLPASSLLTMLSPIVRGLLSLTALLCLFTAFFFRWFTSVPHAPFWSLIAAAVVCVVLLRVHGRALRFLEG